MQSVKKLIFITLALVPNAPIYAQNWPAHFVKQCGTEFCYGDSTFYFAGTNVYDFFTFGNGYSDQNDSLIEAGYIDKARIDAHMQRMANAGVSVVRLWVFSHEEWNGFEPQEGVFHEPQFKLIDYVIESARMNHIFLVPTIENYWDAYGGIDKRLSWEGVQNGHPGRWRFFNRQICPGCFDQYKKCTRYLLNHVNHYSNVAYKDEKVIFAWDLMNEPRYQDATPSENATGTTLRAWVDTMARFIKSIDANHMVYAGIEGHEARYGFGGDEGNPFVYTQQSQWIDFTSAHPYPTEGWAALNIQQTQALVKHWIDDSRDSCKKPFFMGEFNMHNNNQYGTRAEWWKAIFETFEQAGGNGSAFWWFPDKNNDPNFGVSDGSAEMTVFKQHCQRMKGKCKPYVSAALPVFKSLAAVAPVTIKTLVLINRKTPYSSKDALFSISGAKITKQSGTGVIIVERGKAGESR
jgi:hypothetical protein